MFDKGGESLISSSLGTSGNGSPHSSGANKSFANRVRWHHSPIVQAMLRDNTLRSCAQAEDLFAECQSSHSDDRICEVAARQLDFCVRLDARVGKIANDRLKLYLHNEE